MTLSTLVSWLRHRFKRPLSVTSAGHRVFVSYAHEDEQAVNALVNDLQTHGVTVWFGPKQLAPGDPLDATILKAIDQAEYVLVALSRYAPNSPWVAKEVEYALERARIHVRPKVIPLYLTSRDTPVRLREHKAIDIREYVYRAGLIELVDTLHGRLPTGQTPLGRFERFVDSLPVIGQPLYDALVSASISVRVAGRWNHAIDESRVEQLRGEVRRAEDLLRQARLPANQFERIMAELGQGVLPLPVLTDLEVKEIHSWLRFGTPATLAIAASLYDFSLFAYSGQVPSRNNVQHWCEAWVARGELPEAEVPDLGALLRQLSEGRLIRPLNLDHADVDEPIERSRQFRFGAWLGSVGKAAYLFDKNDPERPSPTSPIGRYPRSG